MSERKIQSREKGKRGERDAARVLTDVLGIPFNRSQQFKGAPDSADLAGPARLAVEVKYRERLNVRKAYEVAWEECSPDEIPLLMHRKKLSNWLVTLEAKDLGRLAYELFSARLAQEPDKASFGPDDLEFLEVDSLDDLLDPRETEDLLLSWAYTWGWTDDA